MAKNKGTVVYVDGKTVGVSTKGEVYKDGDKEGKPKHDLVLSLLNVQLQIKVDDQPGKVSAVTNGSEVSWSGTPEKPTNVVFTTKEKLEADKEAAKDSKPAPKPEPKIVPPTDTKPSPAPAPQKPPKVVDNRPG